MERDYTIAVDIKGKALVYRDGSKTLRFDLDSRARPMVVYLHEYLNEAQPGVKVPLSENDQNTVIPRINQYFMKNKLRIKVTLTGLRTSRKRRNT